MKLTRSYNNKVILPNYNIISNTKQTLFKISSNGFNSVLSTGYQRKVTKCLASQF